MHVVEVFHAFDGIDTAIGAEEIGSDLAVFEAPDNHAVAAKRLQQAPRFVEELVTEPDALIFRPEVSS